MAPFLLANFLATLYFVFYLSEGLGPPYRYSTKYNIARKLAKGNGAIIYAEAGRIYPTLYLALIFLMVYYCRLGWHYHKHTFRQDAITPNGVKKVAPLDEAVDKSIGTNEALCPNKVVDESIGMALYLGMYVSRAKQTPKSTL